MLVIVICVFFNYVVGAWMFVVLVFEEFDVINPVIGEVLVRVLLLGVVDFDVVV